MRFIEKWRDARRRRLAARELRALGPEILGDIGVEPDRIRETVSGMLAASETAESKSASSREFRSAAASPCSSPLGGEVGRAVAEAG